jgi:hypothetical protein
VFDPSCYEEVEDLTTAEACLGTNDDRRAALSPTADNAAVLPCTSRQRCILVRGELHRSDTVTTAGLTTRRSRVLVGVVPAGSPTGWYYDYGGGVTPEATPRSTKSQIAPRGFLCG